MVSFSSETIWNPVKPYHFYQSNSKINDNFRQNLEMKADHKMDQQAIGKFIEIKRREQLLTQQQLAERIGVSNKTVSKWENGRSLPDYSVVEGLCAVLNISVSELIAGKEKEPDANESSQREEIALLSYKVEQLEKNKIVRADKNQTIHTGVSFGCVIAAIISYAQLQSIGWAILHGMLSWIYVVYYLIVH